MSLNKFIAVLALAALLVVTLAAGLIIRLWFAEPVVWLASTSPDQKYTMELTGDKGRGGFIIFSVVKYNILVDGKLLSRDRLAHQGDFMDITNLFTLGSMGKGKPSASGKLFRAFFITDRASCQMARFLRLWMT